MTPKQKSLRLILQADALTYRNRKTFSWGQICCEDLVLCSVDGTIPQCSDDLPCDEQTVIINTRDGCSGLNDGTSEVKKGQDSRKNSTAKPVDQKSDKDA